MASTADRTTATGNIGSEIVRQLTAKGVDFIAGSSSGSIDGVPSVKIDFADKDSLVKAMQGVSTLFMVLPSHPDMVKMGENITNAAKESGLDYTITAPSFFMQNFSTNFADDYKNGAIYLSSGNGKMGFVDVRDNYVK